MQEITPFLNHGLVGVMCLMIWLGYKMSINFTRVSRENMKVAAESAAVARESAEAIREIKYQVQSNHECCIRVEELLRHRACMMRDKT